jgi:hypothetical protein
MPKMHFLRYVFSMASLIEFYTMHECVKDNNLADSYQEIT